MNLISKTKPDAFSWKSLSNNFYKLYFRENVVEKDGIWNYDEYTSIFETEEDDIETIVNNDYENYLAAAKLIDEQKQKEDKIATLQCGLNNSDYKVLKTVESFMIGSAPSYDFSKILTERAKMRDDINAIESNCSEEQILTQAKERKITEMCAFSQAIITNGIDYNNEHFRLNTTDQINLSNLGIIAAQGKKVPYHADGEVCRIFEPEEMTGLVEAGSNHVIYHTTYFNLLKHQIMNMTSLEEVNQVFYGMELIPQYQAIIDAIVNK